jgi:EAL domain-containing protein (putative c-di-GMP-specific phosphodiesterase class I)/GGDEF domain-containing protein
VTQSILHLPHSVIRRTVLSIALVLVPVASVTAYILSSDTILLAIALTFPAMVMLAMNTRDRDAPPATRRLTEEGEEGLVTLLEAELASGPSAKKTACIVFSIDKFSEFAQDLDRVAIDTAMKLVLDRMKSAVRAGDDVMALSPYSFGVIVRAIRAPETSAVLTLCERIDEATSAPLQLDGGVFHVTLSSGFCLDARADERTGTAMLTAAKAALDEAMQNAPRAIRGYSHRTIAPIQSALSEEVLQALENGQIKPWFQPQISTDTGEITGFEALARWEHPTKGILPPTAFVPTLEAAHRLEELGEAILNQTLRSLSEWDKAGALVPAVSVNFATQELRNPSLVERIKWDVDRFELDPSRLTVEIIETVISEHDDDIITRNIRALGSQGFGIDLDDFGTGHASLSNIRRFAVDRIKIDRSFVANVDSDPEQQRMVAAIIGLGERLGIETLAEGVENIGEQSLLSQLGCNHLQGFAIARPMPFDKTIDWILHHQNTLNNAPVLGKRIG